MTHEVKTVPGGVKLMILLAVVVPVKVPGTLPEMSESSSSAMLTSVSSERAPAGNSIAILLPPIDGKSLSILVLAFLGIV